MLKTLASLFGAVLFAATTSLYAQATPAPAPKADRGGRHFDCSQAKDPKACEERREKVKAAYSKAKSACETPIPTHARHRISKPRPADGNRTRGPAVAGPTGIGLPAIAADRCIGRDLPRIELDVHTHCPREGGGVQSLPIATGQACGGLWTLEVRQPATGALSTTSAGWF